MALDAQKVEVLMPGILVIQTAFIGDAVLTLPMIQKLRELNPDSFIDVLCTPVTKEIFESSPSVRNVIVMDKRGEHKSFSAIFKLGGQIAKIKYDKIYSPHRSFRSALLVLLSGVRNTYGFNNSSFKYVYKFLIPYDKNSHEVKRNLLLIGYDPGEHLPDMLPEITVNKAGIKKVEEFKKQNRIEKYIVLAPCSVWNTKVYPAEYFRTLTDHFTKKGYKVILMGSEKDSFKLKEFLNYNDKLILAAGVFSLVESVELLRGASLLISNDSAPAHFGLCANIPVLMLYCSTIPGFGFFPYSRKSSYLNIEGLDCKPCGIHGKNECPIKTFDCGFKLTPDLVINKTEELINE